MSETKARSVEKLAAERWKFCFFDNKIRSSAIKSVANDRVLEGGEVHADLMRAPCVELDFKQRGGAEALKDTPVRVGFARTGGCGSFARGHAHAIFGVA
jgi:hypothetical protein